MLHCLPKGRLFPLDLRQMRQPTSTDSTAAMNEHLLHHTAEQLGVTSTGEFEPCTGCSMEQGLRKAIRSTKTSRATQKLRRVFVDLSGKKSVASIGVSHFTVSIHGDNIHYILLVFLSSTHQMRQRKSKNFWQRCVRASKSRKYGRIVVEISFALGSNAYGFVIASNTR